MSGKRFSTCWGYAVPVDIRVIGVDELAEVGRRLKETGDKELRRDLLRGMNRATKPVKAKVKAAALRDLPRRGGLNRVVASARISTRTRTSGNNPAVFLTGKKSGHDLRAIDRGRLRHPVFGNREVWVSQDVKPGWWSRTVAAEADEVGREVRRTLDEVARRLAGGS